MREEWEEDAKIKQDQRNCYRLERQDAVCLSSFRRMMGKNTLSTQEMMGRNFMLILKSRYYCKDFFVLSFTGLVIRFFPLAYTYTPISFLLPVTLHVGGESG